MQKDSFRPPKGFLSYSQRVPFILLKGKNDKKAMFLSARKGIFPDFWLCVFLKVKLIYQKILT